MIHNVPACSRAPLVALVALVALVTAACAGMSKVPEVVLVAGATGQTGRQIVNHLQQSGYRVRALVRDPLKVNDQQLGPQTEYVVGDVKDRTAMAAAMSGVTAVISSIGARGKDGPDRPEMVDYGGVKNLVDAAKAAKVRQFVLVSSRGVTQPDNPLNRMFGDILVWKLKGEDYLRASGLAYTIVRPGGLLNEPGGTSDLAFEQGDRKLSGVLPIAREDVAIVCVQALKNPGAKFRTFEVNRTDGPPVTDWKAKFASLKPDTKQ
jgi:uncharacterized protein YbjT (DUF2867 family)